MTWNSPRTWVPGEKPPASTLNAHIRDNFKAIGDPWTAYTPTWTAATTDPAINNGSLLGAFSAAGKLIQFWAQITMGSSTTYGAGSWSIGLPTAAVESTHSWLFSGVAKDTSSGGSFPLFGERVAASRLQLRVLPSTAGNAFANASPASPFTWANTDVLFISGTYEAA